MRARFVVVGFVGAGFPERGARVSTAALVSAAADPVSRAGQVRAASVKTASSVGQTAPSVESDAAAAVRSAAVLRLLADTSAADSM